MSRTRGKSCSPRSGLNAVSRRWAPGGNCRSTSDRESWGMKNSGGRLSSAAGPAQFQIEDTNPIDPKSTKTSSKHDQRILKGLMHGGHILEFDGFLVDLSRRLLLRDEKPVPLTPKAFDTLAALLEHPGEVLAKEDLLARIWPNAYVEEGILTQNIYTLRKIFQEAGVGRAYIETIPRRGYRFAGPVAQRVAVPRREIEEGITSLAVLPFAPLGRRRGAAQRA